MKRVLLVLFNNGFSPKILKLLLKSAESLSIGEVTERLGLHYESYKSDVFYELCKLEDAGILKSDHKMVKKKAIKIFKINPDLPDKIKAEITRLLLYF